LIFIAENHDEFTLLSTAKQSTRNLRLVPGFQFYNVHLAGNAFCILMPNNVKIENGLTKFLRK